MRRIYDSDALYRDDEDPFAPSEQQRPRRSTAFLSPGDNRTIDWAALSHAICPRWLRHRSLSVNIQTEKSTYENGEPINFLVSVHNQLPLPLTVVTETPVRWRWFLDGQPEASEITVYDEPKTRQVYTFARNETKHYRKQWSQSIRTGKRKWEPVEPGEYTLSAAININDPQSNGLYAETTITIE